MRALIVVDARWSTLLQLTHMGASVLSTPTSSVRATAMPTTGRDA